MTDHATYRDEVGAYLLGALSDAERASFEGHLVDCSDCRHEVERLRPAADLLPRSVEQVEPPPSLKHSLMEVVEREGREQDGEAERRPPRRRLGERLREALGGSLRPVLAAGVLALGLLVGFGIAQLGGDDNGGGGRTVVATSSLPDASGSLKVQGDGSDGAILQVRGMPSLKTGQVYQAWVQRDGMVEPEPTFEVGTNGSGAVAVPEDLSGAQAVLLTREPRGGSRAPSEKPIMTVTL
jgi:anti-sigma-K factor RskA/putative zinc finger protein